tara:strand:+ start:302 stop:871 length:570 start_codon:yes stop_codon:yes gene_type:complete
MQRRNYIVIASCIFFIVAIFFLNKKFPPDPIHKVPYFSYTDQNNKIFTTNDLLGKITIADFFFTGCPVTCPRMKAYMNQIHEFYDMNPGVQFLSISVDPKNDTQSVINNFIRERGLSYSNWFFLQSDEESIVSLLEDGFLLSGEGLPGMHSTKFILIDSNAQILGYYEYSSKEDFNNLISDTTYLLNRL